MINSSSRNLQEIPIHKFYLGVGTLVGYIFYIIWIDQMASTHSYKSFELLLMPQKRKAAYHFLPIHQMKLGVVNVSSQKEDVIAFGVI